MPTRQGLLHLAPGGSGPLSEPPEEKWPGRGRLCSPSGKSVYQPPAVRQIERWERGGPHHAGSEMAIDRTSGDVFQFLRSVGAWRDLAGMTDGQLLGSVIERRDQAAFAALVRRHGPMVWGVCLRSLRNHQDAEDAFQATFLVLVRKAASVVPREMVGNWLYGGRHVGTGAPAGRGVGAGGAGAGLDRPGAEPGLSRRRTIARGITQEPSRGTHSRWTVPLALAVAR
jgi:hypothetical protein